jgi:acetylornithine deacetylase/succinyl-diaminopimelate desuccinylase-like protein
MIVRGISRPAIRKFGESTAFHDSKALIGIATNGRVSTEKFTTFLGEKLGPLGFRTRLGPSSPEGTNEANLIAWKGGEGGSGKGLQYVFSTHMDTVDAGPLKEWKRNKRKPFEIVLNWNNGDLSGLGTSDTKLNIVSLLIALEKLKGYKFTNQVALVFTYGEENGMRGVTELYHSGGDNLLHPDATFVGEPTGLDLVIQHKGRNRPVVSIEIPKDRGRTWLRTASFEVKGLTAHSSRPKDGESAIDKALAMLNSDDYKGAHLIELTGGSGHNKVPETCRVTIGFDQTPPGINEHDQEIVGEMVDNGRLAAAEALKDLLQAISDLQQEKAGLVVESLIDPPYMTVLPTKIEVNAKTGNLDVFVCHRFLPDPKIDAVQVSQDEFRGVVHRVQTRHKKLNTTLVFPGEATPSFSVDPAKPFIQALLKYGRESMGERPELIGKPYGTEAGFFSRMTQTDSTVVFGPGFPEVIHSPKEYNNVGQLTRAADFYELIIRQMVGVLNKQR